MWNWVKCEEYGCDEQILGEPFGVLLDEGGWTVVMKMNGSWGPKAPEDHFIPKEDARRCAEQVLEDLRSRRLA